MTQDAPTGIIKVSSQLCYLNVPWHLKSGPVATENKKKTKTKDNLDENNHNPSSQFRTPTSGAWYTTMLGSERSCVGV